MQREPNPALVEEREHNHLVVSGERHVALPLQSPPRDPLGGRNHFFSRSRSRLFRIEQAGNDAIGTKPLGRDARTQETLQRRGPTHGREGTVSRTDSKCLLVLFVRRNRDSKRCLKGGPLRRRHRGIRCVGIPPASGAASETIHFAGLTPLRTMHREAHERKVVSDG
jgi:hypothetical protein